MDEIKELLEEGRILKDISEKILDRIRKRILFLSRTTDVAIDLEKWEINDNSKM